MLKKIGFIFALGFIVCVLVGLWEKGQQSNQAVEDHFKTQDEVVRTVATSTEGVELLNVLVNGTPTDCDKVEFEILLAETVREYEMAGEEYNPDLLLASVTNKWWR